MDYVDEQTGETAEGKVLSGCENHCETGLFAMKFHRLCHVCEALNKLESVNFMDEYED